MTEAVCGDPLILSAGAIQSARDECFAPQWWASTVCIQCLVYDHQRGKREGTEGGGGAMRWQRPFLQRTTHVHSYFLYVSRTFFMFPNTHTWCIMGRASGMEYEHMGRSV